MYWDGFCAFLPDISGLGGGEGGAQSLQESANLRGGGRGGGVSCFYSFGEPLKTWTYAMLMYSLPRHFTV